MNRFLAASLIGIFALSPVGAYAASASAPLAYPAAPKGSVVDTYFGTQVPDPYRWLESIDSPQTTQWVAAERKLSRTYLDAIPQRAAIATHLAKILNYERISAPSHMKNVYFYTYNSGLQNQSVLYTMNGPHGKPRVLIDPNTLSKDGTVALSATSASWNARYLAYSTQSAGSDWQTWHVRNIQTGVDLPDKLMWSKFSSASWLPDNSGFFYERYPAPKPGQTYKAALSNMTVYFHKLGTAQSADKLFYSKPDHPHWFLSADVTEDGHYVVIGLSSNTSINNRVYYVNLREPGRPVHKLFDKNDAQYNYMDNVGMRFLFSTTLNAPNTRVIAVNLAAPSTIATVIPAAKEALASASTAGKRIFAQYLTDAHSAVRVYDYRGHFIRNVSLPGLGTATGFDGWPSDKKVYYGYSGYTTPPVTYSYDIATGGSTVFRKPKIDANTGLYTTKEVFYRSKDGTRVPMMISYRKGLELNGKNPTLLYAYGGFDIPVTPAFSTFDFTWMQMGGVYAVPNIRGGSEYGEAWHHGGMLANKQNVFDDYIAAAQYLIDHKYTSTPKLAAFGWSNGGLLMGAVETQRPDLFGAFGVAYGVLDMLRFDKFTIGNSWISEYGCATCSKAQFETLYKYSPLQNVRAGTHYPPTLILTADHDDRVFPAHSFKYTATMQADQAGPAPILLRVGHNSGHGGGMPISKFLSLYADLYAFYLKSLHMTLPTNFR